MGKRDFDYRREGWHPSSASDTAVSSSPSSDDDHWGSCCTMLAFHAIQAIMVTICLVVAVAAFYFAEEAAMYSEGYDVAFAVAVSMLLGGFLAMVAAITRCWWLLVLAFLPPIWAYLNQGYFDNGSIATLTYIFDGCVVLLAVGLTVARCRQDDLQQRVHVEEVGDEDDDVDNASIKRPSRSGRNRRAPMVREIV